MRYELVAEELSGETLFVGSLLQKKLTEKTKRGYIIAIRNFRFKSVCFWYGNRSSDRVVDKGKGPVSTILVSNGKLKKGDYFACGKTGEKSELWLSMMAQLWMKLCPQRSWNLRNERHSFCRAEFLVTENENKAKEISEFKRKICRKTKFV